MKIPLKSRRDIELMRAAGRVVHKALLRAQEAARPGMTTLELDRLVYDSYTTAGAYGLFKWYPTYRPGKGFPGNTCISINDEVVHGIPDSKRIIQDGDIVSVDCGVRLGGYCGDAALTVLVGKVDPQYTRLCQVTQEALDLAIRLIRPGLWWSDIARQMQTLVEQAGFSCVREFVGHGIGQAMHEDPKVPNFVAPGYPQGRMDFCLQPGMTIAVEPMVILGKPDVRVLSDGWTVVTADHTPAAHYEHTIAVTATGSDILTDGR